MTDTPHNPGQPIRAATSRSMHRGLFTRALVLLFLFTLCSFLPNITHFPSDELDASWVLTLHWAFTHHLDFGRRIVYTFGPWGFLLEGYTVATFAWTQIAWAFFAVAMFAALYWFASRTLSRPAGLAWMAVVLFFLAGDGIILPEQRLNALCILFVVAHFYADDRPISWVKTLLVLAIAWMSLIKFSTTMLAAPLVALVSADLLIRRKIPWPGIIYILAVVIFWLAADHPLAGFGPFLEHSWAMASGYAQGAGHPLPTDARDIPLFLVCGGALLAFVIHCHAGKIRRSWPAILAAAAIIGFTFKTTFVRHDGHEIGGTLLLLLASLLYLPVIWPGVASRLGRRLLAATVLGCAALNWQADLRYDGQGLPAELWQPIAEFPGRAAMEVGVFFGDQQSQWEIASNSRYLTGPHAPLSDTGETADVYPADTRAVLGAAMNYHPRPLLQSYAAYTAQLAQIDADFLRSSDAPRQIFFEIAPIDRHLASEEDSLSWPELLADYDFTGSAAAGRFLRLDRTASSEKWALQPLQQTTAMFGEHLPVPKSDDPVWITIKLDPTASGRIIAALLRPPPMRLSIGSPAGGTWDYILIPDVAAGGFLLSPVIQNTRQFAALYASDWRATLAGQSAQWISVEPDSGGKTTTAYRDRYAVSFWALRLPTHP